MFSGFRRSGASGSIFSRYSATYSPVTDINQDDACYGTLLLSSPLQSFTLGHITPVEAFVLSLTSFHERGFFPGNNISLSDPRVVLAAIEAVVGLIVEISFIATFTQRFFGK
jgi:hypothetical protein